MDDGASPHRAKSTRQFLSERCRMLTKELQWPAHSADLNVIENCWGVVKSRMDVQEGMTPDDLYDAANRCWESITATEIHNLISSFSARVQACCALQGECLRMPEWASEGDKGIRAGGCIWRGNRRR
jgi:hypothetical protein